MSNVKFIATYALTFFLVYYFSLLYNAFFRYYGQSKREKKKKVGIGVHDFLRICVTKFCVISKVGTKVSLKMDMATFVHIMNEAEQ